MPEKCGLTPRIEELMRLYGEVWTTKDTDRLAEIFSDDIRYIEKPERLLQGMAELREYWEDHVGSMEETIYEPLYDEFDVSDVGSWAWVKFRAGFKKPNKHRKANQWVARLTINEAGLICVFEEYWSKINWEVVGLEEWLTSTVLVSASQDLCHCVSLTKSACEPLLQDGSFATTLNSTSLLAALQKQCVASVENMFSMVSNEKGSVSASMFALNFGALLSPGGVLDNLLPDGRKDVIVEDLMTLFKYIDTDRDGHISLSDFQDSLNTRYVCRRRIGITDSAEIALGVDKTVHRLNEGDLISSVDAPFQVSFSGTTLTRVKCKLPGTHEIGFATISGTHGQVFLEIDSPMSKLLQSTSQSLESAIESIGVLEEAVGAECAYVEEVASPAMLGKIASRVILLHSSLTDLKDLLKSIHLMVKDSAANFAWEKGQLQAEANYVLQLCKQLSEDFRTEVRTHVTEEDADECVIVSDTTDAGKSCSISNSPQCDGPKARPQAQMTHVEPQRANRLKVKPQAQTARVESQRANGPKAKPQAQTTRLEPQRANNSSRVVTGKKATPFELQVKAFQSALAANWPKAPPQTPPSCSWPFPGGSYGTYPAWRSSGNTREQSRARVASISSGSTSSESISETRRRDQRNSKTSRKRCHRSSSPSVKKKRRRRMHEPSASRDSNASSSPA